MKYDETQPAPDDADQASDTSTSKPAADNDQGAEEAKPADAGEVGN